MHRVEWIPAPARVVANAPLPRQIGAMLACAPSLARFLHRQSAAIVHTNDLRMHMTWAAPGRLAGAAHVWHQRTADPSRRNAVYSRLSPAVAAISHYCRGQFPRGMRARA